MNVITFSSGKQPEEPRGVPDRDEEGLIIDQGIKKWWKKRVIQTWKMECKTKRMRSPKLSWLSL